MFSLWGIDVDPIWQAIRVKLMKDYGCISIGGRECMGIINPENTNEAVHLSHSMMDTWATDIVSQSFIIISSFLIC
jgi:hypothetical protein